MPILTIADTNGTCKDIDILEPSDPKNEAFNSSQIQPSRGQLLTQESPSNAFNMYSLGLDDWPETVEEHQYYAYPAPDLMFDSPWADFCRLYSHLGDVLSENNLFRHSQPDDPVIEVNENHLSQRLTSKEYDVDVDNMGGVHGWIEQLDELWVAPQPDSPQHVAVNDGFDQGIELITASRPSSPGSWSIGSAMTSVITGPSNLGGRMMRSTESSTQNAKVIRNKGACFRCLIRKERHVPDKQGASDGICKRCRELGNSNNYRTWGLRCSEIGLDQRGIFMLPKALMLPLTGYRLRHFVKEHVQMLVPNSSIKLALTIGFGEPLRLNAVEVIPRGQGAIRLFGCHISSTGETIALVIESPPVIPLLSDRYVIIRHINHWVDAMIREDSGLPGDYFPEARDLWQREMLTIICQYHREHLSDLEPAGYGAYQTLRWALKLTVLNHIMSHPLVVPDDEVGALAHQLRYYRVAQSAEWICPRLANKVIKNLLVPMLKGSIDQVLDGLQKMLRSRRVDSSAWDQAFCVVFLCLIVVGKTQASLVERAAVGLLNDDDPFTLYAAASEILEMEAELSAHLIGMFHHRFGTMRKMDGYNPLSRDPHSRPQVASQLAESVRLATDSYGMQFAYG